MLQDQYTKEVNVGAKLFDNETRNITCNSLDTLIEKLGKCHVNLFIVFKYGSGF